MDRNIKKNRKILHNSWHFNTLLSNDRSRDRNIPVRNQLTSLF